MPGVTWDGSEDLPNRKLIAETNLCPEVFVPQKDYLKQKLDNAYGELKIITDNIQLLKPHHVSKLIELNSMIGNILHWQLLDREEQEAKCKS